MPRTKAPKEPVKASVTFSCPTCDCHMDGMELFKKHLREEHKITKLMGTQKMRLHMDFDDCAISEFELVIGGLSFLKVTSNPRRAR